MSPIKTFFKEVYDFQKDAWASILCDLPKITFPPITAPDPSVYKPGTPLFRLQQKVNAIMEGVIPYLDLTRARPGELPRGFHLLKGDPCVFWHDDLPEYVLKTTGNYPDGWPSMKICYLSAEEDLIGRVPMAIGMRKVVDERDLDRLYVVNKHLLTLPLETWREYCTRYIDEEGREYRYSDMDLLHPMPKKHFERYKYIVAAEKMDLTSHEETKAYIKAMDPEDQKILMKQLFELFYLSGYQDGHYWNFAFAKSGTQKGKLILYDTEPLGLIERHRKISTEDPITTQCELRQLDISCGEYAMKEALQETDGLFFDPKIKQEVFEEFKEEIGKERENYEKAKSYLRVLPFIPAVPLAASLIFQQIYPV